MKNAAGRCSCSFQYSNPTDWYAVTASRLEQRFAIDAAQTAIEYEYRFTEYRPPRRTEYEYDEIRCAARTLGTRERRLRKRSNGDLRYRRFATNQLFVLFSVSQSQSRPHHTHCCATGVLAILQEVLEAGSFRGWESLLLVFNTFPVRTCLPLLSAFPSALPPVKAILQVRKDRVHYSATRRLP